MAFHKKEAFSESDQQIAQYARAISHPARVAILRILAERQTCICGEIVDVMPLSQSTVSQHLRELKEAGLIRGTIDGPKSCYCLNPDAVRVLGDMMNQLLGTLQKPATSCCD